MNETGSRAAVVRNSADWEGSGFSEDEEGPAVAGLDKGDSSTGVALWTADDRASAGGKLASAERNVISWVTQSIDGLCRRNHENPRTAEAESSSEVRRKRTECCAPQGRRTRRVVYWIMSPWVAVEPSNSDRRSGFLRFSSLKLLEIANRKSIKQ